MESFKISLRFGLRHLPKIIRCCVGELLLLNGRLISGKCLFISLIASISSDLRSKVMEVNIYYSLSRSAAIKSYPGRKVLKFQANEF